MNAGHKISSSELLEIERTWIESELIDISARAAELHILLTALAQPVRLEIALTLFQTSARPSQLAQSLGLSRSTISHHLKSLAAAGLVHHEQEGKTKLYTLASVTRNLLLAATNLRAE